MQGKYPRTIYVVLTNPLPGKEAEFNYWYNYVHGPDGLGWGIFDRLYRYKAIDDRPEQFLAVWESDYTDLTDEMRRADRETEELADHGRLWPVFERAWSHPFNSTGPVAPPNHKPVTLITTVQMNCPRDQTTDFFRWHDNDHIGQVLASGQYHTAYRFERTDAPPQGESKFLTVYESDAALPNPGEGGVCGPGFTGESYEKVSDNHVRVKALPDIVIEVRRHWVTSWLPIWP